MMFDWDDLRFFLEVTRAASVSGAANKLGVNHTTVARRIQSLEKGLSARLFNKTPTGYVLTGTGSQLLRMAEQVESACLSARELVAGQNAVLTGTVRLSVPEGFGSSFLMKHLGEFYQRYPGIEVEMMALPQLLSIAKREADIAITLFRPNIGRLIVRDLTECTLRLYGAREYLERAPPITCVEDLTKHDLISTMSPQFNYLAEVLPSVRVRLRIRSINAQLAAAEAGLGLAMLPCFMADFSQRLTVVLPEELQVRRAFYVSMHEDMRNVSRVKVVWEWIKETVAAHKSTLLGGEIEH